MNKLQSTKAAILSTLLIGAISFTLASCSGDDGSDGATGAKGETGAAGAAGEAGAKGDKGDTGAGCTVAEDKNFITITCGTNVVTHKIVYDFIMITPDNGTSWLAWMTEDLKGTYTWEQALTACPDGWGLPPRVEGQATFNSNQSFFEGDSYWAKESYTTAKAYTLDRGGYASPEDKTSTDPKVRCVKDN